MSAHPRAVYAQLSPVEWTMAVALHVADVRAHLAIASRPPYPNFCGAPGRATRAPSLIHIRF